MADNGVFLRNLLQAKEKRAKRQQTLIGTYRSSLISFTLNIPGPEKDSNLYRQVSAEGIKELESRLNSKGITIIYGETQNGISGPEAFVCMAEKGETLKKITVDIEESHPLGRLFDFDVFDQDCCQVERAQLGMKARKCFLCPESAAVCARSRRHSLQELLIHCDKQIREYFN